MTAIKGLGTYGNAAGVVTPLDHKMAQSGLIVKTTTLGVIRPGLFYNGTSTIVSGKANMSYDVAAFNCATQRSAAAGVVLGGNDGTLNVVTTAAPGSNSRYDVVYFWPREYSLDGTDSTPVIGVVQGTAAASPTVPSLAAFPGAIELARILVPAGVTATNTGTTITQTAPFTTTDGGEVPFRNTTEMDAWTTALQDQRALDLATGIPYRYVSSAWTKWGAPFAATQTARTATSTISVSSPTAPATLPTTAWTASVTPKRACRAKITFETYITSAAGGVEIGFTLSSGVTLAFDEFTPGGGSSAGAYATQNTGYTHFSKIVDLPAAATTVTVVARQIGAAGAKTVGAGNLIIEPVMS